MPSPTAGFYCLLFYGGFAVLMLSFGTNVEVRFDLRDRTCRQTRLMWGIRQDEKVSSLDEIAGLRLCQTYSARNPIWVQIVWRDQDRRPLS